ncbi:MAG: hypothetical protein RIB63_21610, partial [Fulvivirga sp.]
MNYGVGSFNISNIFIFPSVIPITSFKKQFQLNNTVMKYLPLAFLALSLFACQNKNDQNTTEKEQ